MLAGWSTVWILVLAIIAAPAVQASAAIGRNLSVITSVTSTPGLPFKLSIPSLKVNAIVEQAGLTVKGEMAVPVGRYNVAWYKLGPRPGNIGSAVISGHFGIWKGGGVAVFTNLTKLKKGDKLVIKDDKGKDIIFVVRESRRYVPTADATEVFFSADGKAHLNLVTCEGIWNAGTKNYSKRLVVFTDRL